MHRAVLGCLARTVEAGLERGISLAAHRGGEEQVVAPDDRTRMGKAGDRDFETDAYAGRHVPLVRQVRSVHHTGGVRAAKGRPVTLLRSREEMWMDRDQDEQSAEQEGVHFSQKISGNGGDGRIP